LAETVLDKFKISKTKPVAIHNWTRAELQQVTDDAAAHAQNPQNGTLQKITMHKI